MNCFFCGGAAHPAVGCQYTPRVIVCHRCTVTFWAWFRQHVAPWSRPGRPDFYASILAPAADSAASSKR
jgi:hypothetical protein